MGKLSNRPAKGPVSAVKTAKTPTTRTAQGGVGYVRDAKSELFLLAVTNMVSEDTFYESAKDRDNRYCALIRKVASEDPSWVASLLKWLRTEGNLRSASIVGAVEYGLAVPAGTVPTPRSVLNSVLQRPDEPGEALGYWQSIQGRKLPKWFKRALGDAVLRLYSEFSAFKYDGRDQPIRFADVLHFSQIDDAADRPLLQWLIDRTKNYEVVTPENAAKAARNLEALPLVRARRELEALPVAERRALVVARDPRIKAAGYTWESLSGWLQGPMDKDAWEAVIPQMGYMALLRNLRNFDQAKVSDEVADQVIAKLKDPAQVAKSRQLPMRFLSAYNAAPSDRWKHALGLALDASLKNIEPLRGSSIVLVDTSGSMHAGFSKDGSLMRWDAAALFGIAFARANGIDTIYSFSNSVMPFRIDPNKSVLRMLEEFRRTHFQGGGTATVLAAKTTVRENPNARRLVILTDEQVGGGSYSYWNSRNGETLDQVVPDSMALYNFNLAGYRVGSAPSGEGNRHTFGGLTDAGFKMMALLERGRDATWPWTE